jgi:hypothetical protein
LKGNSPSRLDKVLSEIQVGTVSVFLRRAAVGKRI